MGSEKMLCTFGLKDYNMPRQGCPECEPQGISGHPHEEKPGLTESGWEAYHYL